MNNNYQKFDTIKDMPFGGLLTNKNYDTHIWLLLPITKVLFRFEKKFVKDYYKNIKGVQEFCNFVYLNDYDFCQPSNTTKIKCLHKMQIIEPIIKISKLDCFLNDFVILSINE